MSFKPGDRVVRISDFGTTFREGEVYTIATFDAESNNGGRLELEEIRVGPTNRGRLFRHDFDPLNQQVADYCKQELGR